MYQISTLNQISVKGLERFSREQFEVASDRVNPDAILCRSAKITKNDIAPTLKAIARAGAGTDKICVNECSDLGIPVFNTPGANANSVKELVVLSLLLSSRGVIKGVQFVKKLAQTHNDPTELTKAVEKGKKQFAGTEIKGKTLGVVGLGAIGSLVADIALRMGMEVLGYDPGLSIETAWKLSNKIKKMENLPTLLSNSDFVTLHLPMLESTKYMINSESLAFFKKGAKLMNFSREGIVDPDAVKAALDSGNLGRFVCDFPYHVLIEHPDVITMPHIGASTSEAEENCAVMASNQLIDFLINGNIKNSVNFPNIFLERNGGHRITFTNSNIPNMLNQVLALLAKNHINVLDMVNRSRKDVAYSIIDTEQPTPKEQIEQIAAIEGVHIVRSL